MEDSRTNNSTGKRLVGRVAIVTGAGTGIGQGVSIACAKEGADLVIVGRRLEPLEKTAAAAQEVGVRVRIVQGSVTEREVATRAAAEAREAFGRADILVNNAHSFTNPHYSVEETPEEYYRIHMESGFFGTLYFMQEFFPLLREGGGSVINVVSMAGFEGFQTMSAYAASKEAIRALTRVASRDWGQYKIRVNAIAPSSHSEFADQYLAENPEFEAATVGQIPLGYLGDPELDIGRVVAFLGSDDSRYISGRTLRVDGGM
ncbi:MAG: SDR family oxidoreductase [Sphingomonadales bacterium]|nr:SDR family oxidoreductase [Sphingomonadales bacterium]